MTMVRKFALLVAVFIVGIACVFGQEAVPKEKEKEKPAQEGIEKKEIKNVPSTESKAKPAKISSAARPSSVKPNQPVPKGKPPAKGKPQGTGKPNGN